MQTWKRIRRDSTGSICVLRTCAAAVVVLVLPALPAIAAPTEGNDFFESKVRPILVENCQRCHGIDEQSSGLRLDSGKAALTGGDSGPAVVPGKPEDSELFRRITDPDDEVRMPPAKEGKRLNEEQIAAIKEWIKAGAPWPESTKPIEDAKAKLRREHWAFQPVKHVDPPEVHDTSRVRTPVDQFVIAKLEAAGLQLSPEADRRTLIRRTTYDLTGLPPTAEEVDAFVNDTRPDAYERLIDRLLDSPRYGEQWGRYWLDIARFSDTKGYVYTRENRFYIHSALYRDWVINSVNEDMPYDRFVTLQIAADQAAPDDPESLVAMGFLTLGRRMLGVTPDIIEDRIDMVGRGLLGLTIGCARCHDHKFDPIPTADYYSLYGVFQNCAEREVPVPRKKSDADDNSTNKENSKDEENTPAELKKLQKELVDGLAEHGRKASARVRARIREYLAAQRDLENYVDLGIIATASEAEVVPGFVHRFEAYIREAAKRHDPVFTVWNAYAALKPEEFADHAAEVHDKLQADLAAINPRIAKAFVTPATSPDDVVDRYAKVFIDVDAEWKKLCDDAKAAGQPEPQALPDANDEAVRQALYGPDSPCVVPDEPVANTEYLWNLKEVESVWKLQSKVDQYLLQHPRQAPCAVVLTDRKTIVDPQIFRRGNPMNKGETVPRRFVEIASVGERKPFEHGSGRLDLARAIVDPNNPLTSRVWVNRVWLHHFGAGIVTTPSDFGARSTPPSHPELLDWLASEFVQHGWSTKWLHRTLMLSSAYRQSSERPNSTAQLAKEQKLDPENRLLWRMNPHRLTFEQFRDTLLADSQELSDRMGGKGADMVSMRRSVYLQIDRQYLPTVFSVFDFASPDLHTSQRSETTNPQQALFALNNPFVADRARKIATSIQQEANKPELQASLAYRAILQRTPTPDEAQAAAEFIKAAGSDTAEDAIAADAKAWSYGYGEVDVKSGLVKSFHPLPHFTGSAWQGGTLWPDSALGWVRLTAKGGHTGNDHVHAAIRRWTAKSSGTISIKSEIAHQDANGDGVRCWIVSNKDGVLAKASAFNSRESLDVKSLAVERNDTLDFVVDVNENLGYDEFTWIPAIKELAAKTASKEGGSGNPSDSAPKIWNSEHSFPRVKLKPLEQLVQLLLVSNEVMFLD